MPLPLGRVTRGFLPEPMTNTFVRRVANWWPIESLTWTMSTVPMCFSVDVKRTGAGRRTREQQSASPDANSSSAASTQATESQRTAVDEGADAAHVTATSAEHKDASVELDVLGHAASLEVNLDRVVDLDVGVGVADGAAVVRHNVRHALGANLGAGDLAQLVLEGERGRGGRGRREELRQETTWHAHCPLHAWRRTLASAALILWTV